MTLRFALVGTALACLAGCADDADWGTNRSYPEALETASLTAGQIEIVKKFDLLAFASKDSRYYGLRATGRFAPEVKDIRVYYDLGFVPLDSFVGPTISAFGHYNPLYLGAKNPAHAGILIVRVDGFGEAALGQEANLVHSFLGARYSTNYETKLSFPDSEHCAIFRAEDGYAIEKTLVLVAFDLDTQDKRTQEAVVSCINRAFYYHVGFSNAINLPNSTFVEAAPENGRLFINYDFSVVMPNQLRGREEFFGQSRDQILTAYIEMLEAYNIKGG